MMNAVLQACGRTVLCGVLSLIICMKLFRRRP